jgi:hypothetical protein
VASGAFPATEGGYSSGYVDRCVIKSFGWLVFTRTASSKNFGTIAAVGSRMRTPPLAAARGFETGVSSLRAAWKLRRRRGVVADRLTWHIQSSKTSEKLAEICAAGFASI